MVILSIGNTHTELSVEDALEVGKILAKGGQFEQNWDGLFKPTAFSITLDLTPKFVIVKELGND